MALRVAIAQPVLRWALARIRMSQDELEAKQDFRALPQWLSGEKQPTLKQAEKLAGLAGVPFGYLLLDQPVDDTPALPDFRTTGSRQLRQISPELEQTIINCEGRLRWYTDYQFFLGEAPPELVHRFSLADAPAAAVEYFLENTEWNAGPQHGRDVRTVLSHAMEDLGLLVMRTAIVDNNTSRKLDVAEFRGFTVLDRGFALVFVNGADAKAGQYFSLAHELGHVLLGKPGVSGERNDHQTIERWCNQFAAELLLPRAALAEIWAQSTSLEDACDRASKRFGVSAEVTTWSLVDAHLVSRSEASAFLASRPGRPGDTAPSGGGDYYRAINSRLGARFVESVTGALLDGDIDGVEASRQLGIAKTATLDALVGRVQGVA